MIPGRDGGASIARALLEGGADASLADKAGQTALQHAQKRGLGAVVEMLNERAVSTAR
jgi:ankyrin repeat protein